MSKVKLAMKQQGLRYFSSLTAKQKDKTANTILALKHNLNNLPEPVRRTMLYPIKLNEGLCLYEKIKKQKMFYFDNLKVWLPLNFKQIIKA